MLRVRNFLLQSFAHIFFSIFLVLFFIASVVIFIRIAGLTFVIKINVLELLTLYAYTLPTMLFFVIPLSFFISAALGLSRLSFDYELSVLFALGFSPRGLIKIFLPIAFLASVSLSLLSFILTPLSDIAYSQFLKERKSSIDINLKAGEFGQKLGEWLVYVQKSESEENTYENIVLLSLNTSNHKDGLIYAKKAQISNINGVVEATLKEGKVYRKNIDFMEQINFKTMILRSVIDFVGDGHISVAEYWKRAFYANDRQQKTQRNLSMYALLSLFPLVSLFYYPLLGVKNPRYQRNYTILQVMLSLVTFFGLMYLCATYVPLLGTPLLLIIWGFGGYFLYRHYVERFY